MPYSPTSLVAWQGRITRQLSARVAKARSDENHPTAEKLEEFLRLWRDNSVDGNVRIETVSALIAAARVLAVDSWSESEYFSNIETSLRKVEASLQQLPSLDTGYKPPAPGFSRSMRPPSNFGPKTDDIALPPVEGKPEPELAEPEFPEPATTAVAKKVPDAVTDAALKALSRPYGLLILEVRTSPGMNALVQAGALAYDSMSDKFFISDLSLIEDVAQDLDVGDEVTTTFNGKPVKGIVSKRSSTGDYTIDFDHSDPNHPRQPVQAKREQLRRTDKTKTGAAKSATTSTTQQDQRREYYGIHTPGIG